MRFFPSSSIPCNPLLCGLALLAIAGCASTPATHLYVPDKARATAPPWPMVNPVVEIWKTDATPVDLQVESEKDLMLSGRSLGDDPGPVQVPLDQVAVMYYTDQRLDPAHPGPVSLDVRRLPSVRAVGAAEQALGCDALDIELQRAEALHGLARQSGALALSASQRRHSREIGAVVAGGLLLIWPITVSYGAAAAANYGLDEGMKRLSGKHDPAPAPPKGSPKDVHDPWALARIDDRLDGLLAIKEHKGCAPTPARDGGETDVDGWRRVEHTRSAGGIATEEMLRDFRTELFDRLSPIPVKGDPVPGGFAAGETLAAYWREVTWYLGKDMVGEVEHLHGVMQGVPGFLLVTDRAMYIVQGGVDAPTRIPFTAIEEVKPRSWGRTHELLVRYRDGHLDSCGMKQGAEAATMALRTHLGAARQP